MTNSELADEIERSGYGTRLALLITKEHWQQIIAALRRQQPSDQAQARVAELEKAATAMCESYADHADRCRVCTVNWQNLKVALKSRS